MCQLNCLWGLYDNSTTKTPQKQKAQCSITT
jgi:hypothetical protein